jgi:hypothetical protein
MFLELFGVLPVHRSVGAKLFFCRFRWADHQICYNNRSEVSECGSREDADPTQNRVPLNEVPSGN